MRIRTETLLAIRHPGKPFNGGIFIGNQRLTPLASLLRHLAAWSMRSSRAANAC
jgi:hypothetical protein